ncbi:unnamed protein product [Cyclocybe aegerita]|uniref:CCHC-type domain-containing protein n=1 Tax=Cyclocybe aegerita TaxID=1973307 RepID=A0A8S0VT93_CYCAE|nr:unnamed protein product [Cyclocybe aegerita]
MCSIRYYVILKKSLWCSSSPKVFSKPPIIMSRSAEIIDLTTDSPSQDKYDSDVELVITPTAPSNQESRKIRRKRCRKSCTSADPQDAASKSRINSPDRATDPDRRTKRKRNERGQDSDHEQQQNVKTAASDRGGNTAQSQDLFFIDLNRSHLPSNPPETLAFDQPLELDEQPSGKLLLPSHVVILGDTPVDIITQALPDSDEDDFIKYLEYDDRQTTIRYYNDPPSEAKTLDRTVCKNCGAEGEHKTSACPVQICLTCGARDEHSTRSCSISKVCFTCGMKGHINANCPNRRSARALMSTRESECDRCSESSHKTNECPTWWRLYEYFSVEEQAHILTHRQAKKDMKLGQGGEGYVADDEWCYNCGDCGHWGDDCEENTVNQTMREHSAFSLYNIMGGPFYDPDKKPMASTSRSHVRDWDQVDNMSGWGKGAPERVGRDGRMKSRAALERQARQVEDDQEDWFGKRSQRPSRSKSQPSGAPKKITFGKSLNQGRQYPSHDNGPPSLLARLGEIHPGESRSSHSDRRDRSRRNDSSKSHREYHRREDRPSSHYGDRDRHRQNDTGPRYRGGYSR